MELTTDGTGARLLGTLFGLVLVMMRRSGGIVPARDWQLFYKLVYKEYL